MRVSPRRLAWSPAVAKRLLLGVGCATILSGIVVATAASGPTFSFDGSPGGPLAVEPANSSVLANFDVAVHSRDTSTWYQPEAMAAAHGSDCGAPPATHNISSYEDSVFQCKDHIMTAIKAGGYGEIVLTPNQIVDFSGGSADIKFDVSTLRSSGRDFIDFSITPYQENVQLPFDEGDVDLEGTAKDAIHIYMPLGTSGVFKASVIRNFISTDIPGDWSTGYESFLKPDAARPRYLRDQDHPESPDLRHARLQLQLDRCRHPRRPQLEPGCLPVRPAQL